MTINPIALYDTKHVAMKKHIKHCNPADQTTFGMMTDGIRKYSIRTNTLIAS